MNQWTSARFRSSKAFFYQKYELNKITKHIGQLYVPKLPENYFNGFIICFSSLYSITLFCCFNIYFAEKYRFAFSCGFLLLFYIIFVHLLTYYNIFFWNGFFNPKTLKHFNECKTYFRLIGSLDSLKFAFMKPLATNEPLDLLLAWYSKVNR
jgi:hypothetical protein